MKKVLAILAFVAIASVSTIAAFCVQPKGQLQGTINHLKGQGYSLTSIDCAPINYFVAPTPPYVNSIITVRMRKTECPGINEPCISLGSAMFTADEVVINKNGNTIHTNVSQIFVAL